MYTKASAGSPAPVAPEFFAQRDAEIARRFDFLLRFFTPRTVFLELGTRDCELSLRAATYVDRVWSVDAPHAITRGVRPPSNLRLLRAGGLAAIPAESVDVAFCEELKDPERVHRVLAPGGIYFVCGQLVPAQLFREAGFSRVVYYAGRARVPASLARVSRATTVAAHK
ncbi:MAG: hypothetical protein A3G81_31090 [Betaproteobacteria bacterium RIFCSPLOWO2_12_FULL_65_14]|nr:MAG: hypothetical protein A3G81_31090 [Betaproteobacteria bacterium RIFCSPLOWO2_12_FULL_65_14]